MSYDRQKKQWWPWCVSDEGYEVAPRSKRFIQASCTPVKASDASSLQDVSRVQYDWSRLRASENNTGKTHLRFRVRMESMASLRCAHGVLFAVTVFFNFPIIYTMFHSWGVECLLLIIVLNEGEESNIRIWSKSSDYYFFTKKYAFFTSLFSFPKKSSKLPYTP